MPHLDLRKNRMITSDTPYTFELQSYYNRKTKSYSFPICGDIIRRITNPVLSEGLKTRLSHVSGHQERLSRARKSLAFPDDRLEDYQKSGAEWLFFIRKGILADDQGSGKTVTALAAAKKIDAKRNYVICSKTKRDEWCDEIRKWTGGSALILKPRIIDETADYIVMNYDAAMNDPQQFFDADLVIIDEAHILRNRKTRKFKQLRKICNKAKYVFLLTATPTVNEISDLWTLLCLCDEQRFRSYWGFAFRFCEIDLAEMGIKVGDTKESEKENLRRLLNQYVLSREGTTVLPEPEWVRIEYNLGEIQRDLYNQMDVKMSADYMFDSCEALTTLAQMTRLRQLALDPALIFHRYSSESKLDLLPGLVGGWEGQTLIFAQYAELVRRAADFLIMEGLSSTYLTSKLDDTDRAESLFGFKEGHFKVLAMTYKMGGEGLNLPEASQAIFLEYAWNPASIRHAYKRILRRGQTNDKIRFVFIHANNTIEDHIRDILREKKKVTVERILRRKSNG